MAQEKCDPKLPCEINKEEVNKIQLNDPATYCFKLASKPGDVCLPRSCPLVKKGLIRRATKDETLQDYTVEPTGPSTLIQLKQPRTTCIKPIESSLRFLRTEAKDSKSREKVSREASAVRRTSSESNSKTGPKSGQQDVVVSNSKSEGAMIAPPNYADPLSLMGISGAGAKARGVVTSSASKQLNKETASLARLMGIAEGPSAIMASFGNIESAKESLASIGALSTAGAIVCDCCECDPCFCGPRGLTIENIVVALKKMMHSGHDLNKLIAALGPGAMAALETIMAREGETAAEWAAGGVTSDENFQLGEVEFDGTTMVPRLSAETESYKALGRAWLRGDFDEMTSCHCLPGMCPCPGDHYVFKDKKTMDKNIETKKMKRRIRKKIKKINKDGKEYEEWDWVAPTESDVNKFSETCVCPPTKHFLTPASSETDTEKLADDKKKIYWGDFMVCTCPRIQRTLVIIKPECVKFKDVVFRGIKSYGLDILDERKVHLSPEEASEIYAKYYGTARFPNMVVSISQAPVIVLSISGIDVVRIWNHIIGPDGTLPGEWFLPDWISRKFGSYGEIVDALHGSKNMANAERENRYFFSESFMDPLMKEEADVKHYITKNVNPTLLKGLTLLAKQKPIDPIIFLAEWLLTHNPFSPYFPVNVSLAPV